MSEYYKLHRDTILERSVDWNTQNKDKVKTNWAKTVFCPVCKKDICYYTRKTHQKSLSHQRLEEDYKYWQNNSGI